MTALRNPCKDCKFAGSNALGEYGCLKIRSHDKASFERSQYQLLHTMDVGSCLSFEYRDLNKGPEMDLKEMCEHITIRTKAEQDGGSSHWLHLRTIDQNIAQKAHEQDRKNAWISFASAQFAKTTNSAGQVAQDADKLLAEFDKRFNI